MYEYTTDPLPFPRTGGRGPNGMYMYVYELTKWSSSVLLMFLNVYLPYVCQQLITQ